MSRVESITEKQNFKITTQYSLKLKSMRENRLKIKKIILEFEKIDFSSRKKDFGSRN